MKNIDYIDFKKHKLFLAETIAFVVIMAIFIFGGIYSILFPVIDDVRRKDYDTNYLTKIYSADKADFNEMAKLIDKCNIENISHGDFVIKSEKYFYKDTLYYQTDSELTDNEKSKITDLAYELFDKYDFDVIEFENGKVSFSYIAQDIDLIYCKNKSPYIESEEYLCKSIAKDWYVVEY